MIPSQVRVQDPPRGVGGQNHGASALDLPSGRPRPHAKSTLVYRAVTERGTTLPPGDFLNRLDSFTEAELRALLKLPFVRRALRQDSRFVNRCVECGGAMTPRQEARCSLLPVQRVRSSSFRERNAVAVSSALT